MTEITLFIILIIIEMSIIENKRREDQEAQKELEDLVTLINMGNKMDRFIENLKYTVSHNPTAFKNIKL